MEFMFRSIAIPALFFLCLWQKADAEESYGDCGREIPVTRKYLSKLKESSVNNFIPSAYYKGSSTKFISTTGQTTVNHDYLCVNGANSYKGEIQLYDDGTHGDDFANDGVYSRGCVHFCNNNVDFTDFYGYAMAFQVEEAQLIVIKKSLKGKIPYKTVETPLLPDAVAIASSHAFFFVDPERKYIPDFPLSADPIDFMDASAKSIPISALIQVFGDVFDFVSTFPLETDKGALGGGGIARWILWDLQAGVSPGHRFGTYTSWPECVYALAGIPLYRITAALTASAPIDDPEAIIHELNHGVCGFEQQNRLDKFRSGDMAHPPGSCTIDHSTLQGPVWDWVKGAPDSIPNTKNTLSGVRLVPNNDCDSCADNELPQCCSFRYADVPETRAEILARPNLYSFSPFMLYAAGMIKKHEIPRNKQTFYCMGSNTDGGCGTQFEGQDPCTKTVDDSNRSKITSDYVSRFTLDEIIQSNGGKRLPAKKYNVVRHGAVFISNRLPGSAEIAFYTKLWRHMEIETKPYSRLPNPWGERRFTLTNWGLETKGNSVLHSRLHGIGCGTDNSSSNVPSCQSRSDLVVCANAPCGEGAICINLDNKPFCICREGLVGDGLVCVHPGNTKDFPFMTSAYDEMTSDKCFLDNKWTSFVSEDSIPPYPGGIAPYSATSCGTNVCKPGWRCINGTCSAPTGKSMCENKGMNKKQCKAFGCCKWRKGKCKRKANTCNLPSDPGGDPAVFNCTDKSTCCYVLCPRLKLTIFGPDNELITQVGNCGDDCKDNIFPDVNGVIHKELHIETFGYYTAGQFYEYDEGPLNVVGADKNMFNRCKNQCFVEDPNANFLFRIQRGQKVIKTCTWLQSMSHNQKRRICLLPKHYLFKDGEQPASLVCKETCKPYLNGEF